MRFPSPTRSVRLYQMRHVRMSTQVVRGKVQTIYWLALVSQLKLLCQNVITCQIGISPLRNFHVRLPPLPRKRAVFLQLCNPRHAAFERLGDLGMSLAMSQAIHEAIQTIAAAIHAFKVAQRRKLAVRQLFTVCVPLCRFAKKVKLLQKLPTLPKGLEPAKLKGWKTERCRNYECTALLL